MAPPDAAWQRAGTPPRHASEVGFAKRVDGDGQSTLILDGLGRICGCGVAAEDIFGATRGRLIGRPVADFIRGIDLDEGPAFDEVRSLAGPADAGVWRTFEATDARGIVFAVDVCLSRRVSDGQVVFVLGLRQPQAVPGS